MMDEELTRIQFQLNAGGLLFGVNGGHRAKCICMKPAMCSQRCTMPTFVQHCSALNARNSCIFKTIDWACCWRLTAFSCMQLVMNSFPYFTLP